MDTALHVTDRFLRLRSGSVYIWGMTMVDTAKIGRKGGLVNYDEMRAENPEQF